MPSTTFVKVRADGVLLHRHPKANDDEGKKWHPVKEMHKDESTHERVGASSPANFAELNAGQKQVYRKNLTGWQPEWAATAWKAQQADLQVRRKNGEVRSRACDVRCTNASPQSECICQCGGVNHAIAYRGEEQVAAVKEAEAIVHDIAGIPVG